MKILYVLHSVSGPSGGVRIILEHCWRLQDRGHDCAIATLDGSVDCAWYPASKVKMLERPLMETAAKRADVVVATEANTVAPVIALETNARKYNFIQMRESLFFLMKNPMFAGMVEENHRRAKGILRPIVISQWLKDFLEDEYGYKDVPIVPNGVNMQMFYPDPVLPKREGIKRILIEGVASNEAKDRDMMAYKAAQKAQLEYGNVELWGFSQGSCYGSFERYWRYPDQDLIRQLYSSCDILLKASRFEGRSCLAPDVAVLTRHGAKPISEIRPHHDHVLGLDGKFHQVTSRTENTYRGELIKLTARTIAAEPILLTPDHPVLAMRTVECQKSNAGLCKPNCQKQVNPNTGLNTRCSKRPYEEYKLEWLEAASLQRGDALVVPYPEEVKEPLLPVSTKDYTRVKDGWAWDYMTNKAAVKIPALLPMSQNAMKLYGLYLAEGWTSDGKIEFALHLDEMELAKEIVDLMGMLFKLRATTKLIPNEKGRKLTFYNSTLARTLEHHFGNGAARKQIPSQLLLAPPSLQASLLYGFFKGDGYLSPNALNMATVSQNLAIGLRTLAFRNGWIPRLYKQQNVPSNINGRHIQGKPIYSLVIGGPDRTALTETFGLRFPELSKTYYTTWRTDHIHFAPINQIEISEYEGEVFDLSVPDTSHFATVSGIVHNCVDVEAMACGTAICRAILTGDDDLIHEVNCLKVKYGDQKGFYKNLKKLLRNDELRAELVKNGLEYVRAELDWTDKIDLLEAAYGA